MATRIVTSHDLASFTRQVNAAWPAESVDTHPSAIRAFLYRILAGRSPQRATVPPDSIRQILIIRPDSIGDYVVTTPLVDWISRHLPYAAIDILVQEHSLPLVVQDPRYRSVGVITYNASPWRQWQQVRALARGVEYDVVFALSVHRVTQSIIMARAAGSKPLRVGLEQPIRNNVNRRFFDHTIEHYRPLRHWCESFADAGPMLTGLPVDPDVGPWVAQECNDPLPRSVDVVVNISAREAKRRWNSASVYGTIHALWSRRPQTTIAIVAGPEDYERAVALVHEVNDERCAQVNVGVECLPRLAAEARVVVSPDTAMVHIASAVGTPVVGLFLEDHKVIEWGPYRVPCAVLISDDSLSLDRIEPELIADQIRDLLDGGGEATR